MNYNEFSDILKDKANKIGIILNDEKCKLFYEYMNLLLEWNEKINLTAITEPNDIILKHFIDCILINQFLNNKETILDIGTGAGFPGIPLSIVNNNVKFNLVDALNKRVIFLDEVINKLKLNNVITNHGRAEELGHQKEYRESYDVVASRAVAPLNILLEYTLPFVKVGGKCICMKGSNANNEIEESKKALEILGGKIVEVKKVILPDTDIERNIIIIKKIKNTSKSFPRKAGTPKKSPII